MGSSSSSGPRAPPYLVRLIKLGINSPEKCLSYVSNVLKIPYNHNISNGPTAKRKKGWQKNIPMFSRGLWTPPSCGTLNNAAASFLLFESYWKGGWLSAWSPWTLNIVGNTRYFWHIIFVEIFTQFLTWVGFENPGIHGIVCFAVGTKHKKDFKCMLVGR